MHRTIITNVILDNPQEAVDYICNYRKTAEQTLITTRFCDIKNNEFLFSSMQRELYEGRDMADYVKGVRTRSIIQTFEAGAVDPLTAHQIGIEFMDEELRNKHCCVLATHIDTPRIHNHIVFCTAENFGRKRYVLKDLKHYMQIHKRLCEKYGVDPELHDDSKSSPHAPFEMSQEEKKPRHYWYNRIRDDIDSCVAVSDSYEEFVGMMTDRGYTVRNKDDNKRLAFRHAEASPTNVCKAAALGDNYSRDKIRERINERIDEKKRRTKSLEREHLRVEKVLNYDKDKDSDIDFSDVREQPAYKSDRFLADDIGYMKKEVKDFNDRYESLRAQVRTDADIIKNMKICISFKNYNKEHEEKDETYAQRLESYEEAKKHLEAAGYKEPDQEIMEKLETDLRKSQLAQYFFIDNIVTEGKELIVALNIQAERNAEREKALAENEIAVRDERKQHKNKKEKSYSQER